MRVVSACADTSWGLYHAFEDFCCPSDFVGIYPNGGDNGPMCISESLPIPESALASSVRYQCSFGSRSKVLKDNQVKQATTTRAAVSTPGSSTTTSVSSSTTSPGSTSQ